MLYIKIMGENKRPSENVDKICLQLPNFLNGKTNDFVIK